MRGGLTKTREPAKPASSARRCSCCTHWSDVNWRSPHMDRSSILSLFHSHDDGPPLRMSSFDRNALSGFYLQRENNRTADQQRQNIARSIERQEAGKPAVGTKKEE